MFFYLYLLHLNSIHYKVNGRKKVLRDTNQTYIKVNKHIVIKVECKKTFILAIYLD